jgi:hypothetical protein
VSGAVSAGQAAGEHAGAEVPPGAGDGRRGGRRRRAAVVVAVVVLAGAGVAAGVSGVFGPARHAGSGGGADRTSTAAVVRRGLSSQTLVDATLGDAGSYTVVNQASGTFTALPAAGRVVRQGGVLYRVSGSAVVLLYGPVPAWRDLSEGLSGTDVSELNTDLVKLGYVTAAELGPRPGWDLFSGVTAAGVEGLQARLGLTVTGVLALGQAVFLPGAALVTGLATGMVPGTPAMPGSAVLTASSTRPVVTVALDPDQQTQVRAGDKVAVTLPDGSITAGMVSSVGTVATVPASDSGSDSGGGSGGGSGSGSGSATINVAVRLVHPAAAGRLDQAPVEVAITTARVASALTVPVDALLARSSGGYAVEVTGPGGHHLVAVSVGLFDDAAGLVQVSGAGLAAGQRVVVPAL